MALLDVSDVLLDPDFVDTSLVCERATIAVGDDGRSVASPANIPFSGVVTSNNGDVLDRIAEGQRIKGSITIHTRFSLIEGGAGQDADVVQWRGRRYTVTNVNDYAHFGAGFVVAYCDLIPLSG